MADFSHEKLAGLFLTLDQLGSFTKTLPPATFTRPGDPSERDDGARIFGQRDALNERQTGPRRQ